jgi:hypothetical protein
MIRRMVLCLALVSAAGAASAQGPACTLYKVNTSLLNISKDAGGEIYKDALFDGEIACVTRQQKVKDRDWGFVSHKLERANARTPVEGWSSLQYLQQISSADAESLLAGAGPPPAAVAAPPPAASATPAPAAPPPVAAATPAAPAPAPAAIRPEDILRFEQPIPFGPFPVNGRSIKDLAASVPLFPPIEGLDEAVWKKKCTSCHKWDKARLCEQGQTYVKAAKYILRHPHPMGGSFKIALMRWAKSGCE